MPHVERSEILTCLRAAVIGPVCARGRLAQAFYYVFRNALAVGCLSTRQVWAATRCAHSIGAWEGLPAHQMRRSVMSCVLGARM